MVASQTSGMIRIFFSLADEDESLFQQLLKHLRDLRRREIIDVWSDSLIIPGHNIDDSIKEYIRTAHIIVLLLSADFWASDRCVEKEMKYALQRYEVGDAQVIPVLLRPSALEDLPIEQFSLLPTNGEPVSTWVNPDSALFNVAIGIRKVVEKLQGRSSKAPQSSQAKLLQFPLFALSYRYITFFTDRKDILKELHDSFTSGLDVQIRTQSLQGLEGVGKTVIALEYVRLYHHEYQAVLWLDAGPSKLLSANIISLADRLGIPAQDGGDEEQRYVAIRHWLQHHEKWLVVIDNLEDLLLINQLIPSQGSGHLLLILRNQATGKSTTAIPVSQMNIEDGALLLLRRASIIPEESSHIVASGPNFLQAEKITHTLKGYPLVLDLAGAYVKETQQSLDTYLSLYRWQQWTRLLGIQGWFTKAYLNLATNTLALIFQKIAQINPDALELLRFLAFLHPDAFSYEMLLNGASSLTGPLHTIAADHIILDDALALLQRFSLVHQRDDRNTFRMHGIVQLVIKRRLTGRRQRRQLAKQAVCLIDSIFPEVNFKTWAVCERYLPQAQHCSALINDFHLMLEEGGLLLERLGFYYYQRGYYAEATIYLSQALRLQEQHHPNNPLNMAQTLNSLGLLSQRQARYQDARVFHERALKLRERVPDHPHIAESQHNLAVLYEHDGEYQEAEKYYRRAHTLDERILGPDDPDTARTLNNLAHIHYLQGSYSEAETEYRRVLTVYEHSLPPNHPDLAYPLNGLGALAEKRGDDTRAADFYQRALAIREQALGPEHSETVHSINILAHIYELSGNYSQAKELYQQALAITKRTLGPEHHDVALVLNNLALLVYKEGQYRTAEPLFHEALSIYQLTPKAERPAVAGVLNNLGQLYSKTKNEKQAEALLKEALAIRKQVLGTEHPDTAQSMSNLGTLLVNQHRYEEAEPLFRQSLVILLQKIGSAYPEVARVREKYASLLEHMGRNEESAQIRQAEKEEQLPPERPQNNS